MSDFVYYPLPLSKKRTKSISKQEKSDFMYPLYFVQIAAIKPGVPLKSPSKQQGDLMSDLKASANKSTTLSPFVMTSGHRHDDLHMFDADIKQVRTLTTDCFQSLSLV